MHDAMGVGGKDRTWVRDDCVAATPALGNFSSFLQRIKLFFFFFFPLPLQSLLTPRKKRGSLSLTAHKLGCFLEVPGVLLKMLRLGSHLQCLNSLTEGTAWALEFVKAALVILMCGQFGDPVLKLAI